MDDLISRQAAITEFSCCELTPDGGIDANYAIDFLKQLPSIRCKDCKYFERDIMNARFGTCCHPDWTQGNVGFEVDADGYCYRGETLL